MAEPGLAGGQKTLSRLCFKPEVKDSDRKENRK